MSERPAQEGVAMRKIRIGWLAVGFLAILVPSADAGIAATVNQGNHLYKAGEYGQAAEKYGAALQKQPESDIINFNIGSALYKNAQYQQAADHFQKVLLSEDQGLKQKAHYNSGNALYRQGEAFSSENPQGAVPFLKQAIDQYEQALVIDPKDEDAKFNYELAKRFLEKIEKQIQKQQQQKEQQQEQSEQQENQKQDQSSGSDRSESQKDPSADEQPQSDQGQKESPADENRSQNSSESSSQERQETGDFSGRKEQRSQEMSAIKAKQLLDEYEQGQDAKQLLNLRGAFSERPVVKDW